MREWAICVAISLGVSVATFWGLGGLIHYHYYVRRKTEAAQWKLQPQRWLQPGQVRHAFLLGSINILLGSILGGTLTWHVQRGGWSMLYADTRSHGWPWLLVSALVGFLAIDAGLYYSHRLLHHRQLFRYVHRWHHKFVAPIIFTTTAMHPVEFLVFFSALLLPAFVIPMHVAVYVALIGYTYLIGMIDHAGVRLRVPLPLHADNRFHDDHHINFHCNFGHHTALFDQLHDTVKRDGRRYGEDMFHD
jgi:lathosterol oxidase